MQVNDKVRLIKYPDQYFDLGVSSELITYAQSSIERYEPIGAEGQVLRYDSEYDLWVVRFTSGRTFYVDPSMVLILPNGPAALTH